MKHIEPQKTLKTANKTFLLMVSIFCLMAFISCNYNSAPAVVTKDSLNNKNTITMNTPEINKSDSEWKAQLTPEQYYVLREKGTERPFTSKWEAHYDGGTYTCAGCGSELFNSTGKFDSGCGWPSFFEALDSTKIKTETDNSHGMQRIEIMCAKCGGHLGHVFDDGPKPTGLRYCVNGAALNFLKK